MRVRVDFPLRACVSAGFLAAAIVEAVAAENPEIAFTFKGIVWEVPSVDDGDIAIWIGQPLSLPQSQGRSEATVFKGTAWGTADIFAVQFTQAWDQTQLADVAEAMSAQKLPFSSGLAGRTHEFCWFGFA